MSFAGHPSKGFDIKGTGILVEHCLTCNFIRRNMNSNYHGGQVNMTLIPTFIYVAIGEQLNEREFMTLIIFCFHSWICK